MNTLLFSIKRFDGKHSWVQDYRLPYATDTLLGCLTKIREQQDPTLNFTSACRHAICGSCAIRVNGSAFLACETQIDDLITTYQSHRFVLEPLAHFKVIRDLVVDFDPVAEKEKNFKPWLIERDDRHDHLQSQSDFHKIAAPADCIMCGMCASECRELNYETGNYPGPFILNKVYRYLRDSRDGAHEERVHVVLDNDLWKCIHCQQCTTKCAKKIPIADEISFMRRQALSMGETNSMGARHAYSFYNDVRKTGKLNETMLALHTEGMYKTLKNRIPFAMRMVVAGKMNPLDMPRPIKGIKDVRKLYEFSQTIQKED